MHCERYDCDGAVCMCSCYQCVDTRRKEREADEMLRADRDADAKKDCVIDGLDQYGSVS